MAGANSNINLVGLDFDTIKNNLKAYLQGQDTFKDYNFDGSGLSILLDVLAFNTQYNAFYLNMVANEMFLDSSLQRSSVVSHAKLLNYVPSSTVAPTAYVDIVFNGVSNTSFILPAYTNFLSEKVNGVNYNFVTTESTTVNGQNSVATFSDIELKQGIPVTQKFTVDSTTNPTYTFELPDDKIDSSTVKISIQKSSSNSSSEVFTLSNQYLSLDGESKVFFIQEALNGNYEIYFGDGILGKKLDEGNIVNVSYITTQGTLSSGANSFVLMDSVGSYTTSTVYGKVPASSGKEKESIESIKYQAPKCYSSQNRGVTKDDYITLINQNKLGISFDAVNVWGGEENDPPAYGQVFICLKPSGGYSITGTQKQKLIEEVIKPISLVTVTPTIIDPDYTYIRVSSNVIYDPKKTNLRPSQLQDLVKTEITNFAANTLNTFNSTFMASELTSSIKNIDSSIITNELNIQLQKKFYPNLTTPSTYNFYFGVELEKGMFQSNINSYPSLQFRDPTNLSNIITGVYIEEVPSATGGVESISILNPGFSYQYAPTVTIYGDGTGATAEATISASGQLKSITVTNPGSNYTSAIATITPSVYDKTGTNASVVVNLAGRYGTLRTFYNDNKNVKTILNSNIGTIDYMNGIITLESFGPLQVDNDLGDLTISVKPTTTLLSSTYNRILTLSPYDSNAITVNIIAKTQ